MEMTKNGWDLMTALTDVKRQRLDLNETIQTFRAKCFPLTSLLAALGQQYSVDYLNLDVEGGEFRVLQTIPWPFVHIKVTHLPFYHSSN